MGFGIRRAVGMILLRRKCHDHNAKTRLLLKEFLHIYLAVGMYNESEGYNTLEGIYLQIEGV